MVEFDIKVLSGAPKLFFRLGKSASTNVESIKLEAQDPGNGPGITVGKIYHMNASFIGSTFKIAAQEDDDFNQQPIMSPYTHSRRGAIGITIPKGAALEFSKLRIKVLR